jgi:vesicle-fusing ATPase
LVFVTTSQISTLKLLGIMKLFRRQIAVPNIPDLRALQAVLSAESTFDASEMNQVLNSLAADTGSQRVGLGIKTVLETLEESRINSTMEGGLPTAEGFVDRLVGYINAEAADA